MPLRIGGLQKTSLLDFPGKIACIVFTPKCNFRCGYCHNPELFTTKEPVITVPAFFDFIKTRQGKLDGVVITGGEPTLQDGLCDFISDIKNLGFLVKLDTNGSNPNVLKQLLDDKFLDYVAMDIKAPLEKYSQITNVNVDISRISKSIELLKNSAIDYEFRTTVIKSQLNMEDFDSIGKLIQGAPRYYLQKFVASKILDETLMNETTYSNEEFEQICTKLKNYVEFVSYR